MCGQVTIKSIVFNHLYFGNLMHKVIRIASVHTYLVGKCVDDTVKQIPAENPGKA